MMTGPSVASTNRSLSRSRASGSMSYRDINAAFPPIPPKDLWKSSSDLFHNKEKVPTEAEAFPAWPSSTALSKEAEIKVLPSKKRMKEEYSEYLSTRFNSSLAELMESVADIANRDSGFSEEERESLRTDVLRLTALREAMTKIDVSPKTLKSSSERGSSKPRGRNPSKKQTKQDGKNRRSRSRSAPHSRDHEEGPGSQHSRRSLSQSPPSSLKSTVRGYPDGGTKGGSADSPGSEKESTKNSTKESNFSTDVLAMRTPGPTNGHTVGNSSQRERLGVLAMSQKNTTADSFALASSERIVKTDQRDTERSARSTRSTKDDIDVDLTTRSEDMLLTPRKAQQKQKKLSSRYARAASERLDTSPTMEPDTVFGDINPRTPSGRPRNQLRIGTVDGSENKKSPSLPLIPRSPRKKDMPSTGSGKQTSAALPHIPRSPRKSQKEVAQSRFSRASSERGIVTIQPESPKDIELSPTRSPRKKTLAKTIMANAFANNFSDPGLVSDFDDRLLSPIQQNKITVKDFSRSTSASCLDENESVGSRRERSQNKVKARKGDHNLLTEHAGLLLENEKETEENNSVARSTELKGSQENKSQLSEQKTQEPVGKSMAVQPQYKRATSAACLGSNDAEQSKVDFPSNRSPSKPKVGVKKLSAGTGKSRNITMSPHFARAVSAVCLGSTDDEERKVDICSSRSPSKAKVGSTKAGTGKSIVSPHFARAASAQCLSSSDAAEQQFAVTSPSRLVPPSSKEFAVMLPSRRTDIVGTDRRPVDPREKKAAAKNPHFSRATSVQCLSSSPSLEFTLLSPSRHVSKMGLDKLPVDPRNKKTAAFSPHFSRAASAQCLSSSDADKEFTVMAPSKRVEKVLADTLPVDPRKKVSNALEPHFVKTASARCLDKEITVIAPSKRVEKVIANTLPVDPRNKVPNALEPHFVKTASARCLGKEITVIAPSKRVEKVIANTLQEDPRNKVPNALEPHFVKTASARCLGDAKNQSTRDICFDSSKDVFSTASTLTTPGSIQGDLKSPVVQTPADDELSMASTIISSAHMEDMEFSPKRDRKPGFGPNSKNFFKTLSARVRASQRQLNTSQRQLNTSQRQLNTSQRQLNTSQRQLNTGAPPEHALTSQQSVQLSPLKPPLHPKSPRKPLLHPSESSRKATTLKKDRVFDTNIASTEEFVSPKKQRLAQNSVRDSSPQRPMRYMSIANGPSIDQGMAMPAAKKPDKPVDASPQRPMRCLSIAPSGPCSDISLEGLYEQAQSHTRPRDFSPQRPLRQRSVDLVDP